MVMLAVEVKMNFFYFNSYLSTLKFGINIEELNFYSRDTVSKLYWDCIESCVNSFKDETGHAKQKNTD